jgi:hypothetical protein
MLARTALGGARGGPAIRRGRRGLVFAESDDAGDRGPVDESGVAAGGVHAHEVCTGAGEQVVDFLKGVVDGEVTTCR